MTQRTKQRRAAVETIKAQVGHLSNVQPEDKSDQQASKIVQRIPYPTPTSADGDDLCSLNSDNEGEDEDEDEVQREDDLASISGDEPETQPVHEDTPMGGNGNEGLLTPQDSERNQVPPNRTDADQEEEGSIMDGIMEYTLDNVPTALTPRHAATPEVSASSTSGSSSRPESSSRPARQPRSRSPPHPYYQSLNDESPKKNKKGKKDPKTKTKKQSRPKMNCLQEKATLTPLELHGKAPVETTVDNHWVYLFFRFCAERHKMYERRKFESVPRDQLTKDETMSSMHIGNIYRQLDPSSTNIRENIMGKGDQSVKEVCFRLFLFCMFYNEATWNALCEVATGGVPTWSNYISDMPRFEKVLYRISFIEKKKIYYGGFQLVPPTIYFADNRNRDKSVHHFAASLRLVLAIMLTDLPERLQLCKYAIDASELLLTVPTFGGFLSWNIICYLNDTTHFKWFFRNFATCGPGPRSFMARMFGGKQVINNDAMEEAGLIWLYENQWKYWAGIGEDPPHAWELGLKPGMRVLDIENALCWCHRYVNAFERNGSGKGKGKGIGNLGQIPLKGFDKSKTDNSSEPAWCVEERWVNTASRVTYKDDAEERANELDHVENEDDDVYEVERIVCRKTGNARSGECKNQTLFRVRWKGYPPEADTYQDARTIKAGAEESLQEWLDWEKSVWDSIDQVKKDYPYTKPSIAKSEEEEEDVKVEAEAGPESDLRLEGEEEHDLVERPSKRARTSVKTESADA
ncbi:uncharacterized protein I303_103283 [Kwoniella dejecticola CBS 10117]|uniref:Chromo domain-containing protein n=1 Tax=Kwoniella dejecticola CBS 10117 TaxID=1296121 RepID=A0A1A6A6B3_9TREE|nr:uncharacterized protein I303_03307 [Kwoniella dejecticola CBS 10117]OBR85596.1 hypothetical protein I303_03307 [Kwoniella dejecticola CBS 10117]